MERSHHLRCFTSVFLYLAIFYVLLRMQTGCDAESDGLQGDENMACHFKGFLAQ